MKDGDAKQSVGIVHPTRVPYYDRAIGVLHFLQRDTFILGPDIILGSLSKLPVHLAIAAGLIFALYLMGFTPLFMKSDSFSGTLDC